MKKKPATNSLGLIFSISIIISGLIGIAAVFMVWSGFTAWNFFEDLPRIEETTGLGAISGDLNNVISRMMPAVVLVFSAIAMAVGSVSIFKPSVKGAAVATAAGLFVFSAAIIFSANINANTKFFEGPLPGLEDAIPLVPFSTTIPMIGTGVTIAAMAGALIMMFGLLMIGLRSKDDVS
jgi:hypothetical protein